MQWDRLNGVFFFINELEKKAVELVGRRLRIAGSSGEECTAKASLTRLRVGAELSISPSPSTFSLHYRTLMSRNNNSGSPERERG